VVEADARVEVLPDEEVAVVEGRGVDADEELVWARGWAGGLDELESWTGELVGDTG